MIYCISYSNVTLHIFSKTNLIEETDFGSRNFYDFFQQDIYLVDLKKFYGTIYIKKINVKNIKN